MERNATWKDKLLWLIISLSFTLNGALLLLSYNNIVKPLDKIEILIQDLPTLKAQVDTNTRDINRHEAKLDDLQKTKLDKPGL
jgi:hypothetical protein